MTTILGMVFNILGSLCVLLFGMKLLSDGIQKSAGEKLQKALSFMTRNRFFGLFTGCALTMLIQSSGATTVMVVSFVNASLLTLEQSVAVIFGANIGTTITAWIVALFGFDFKISALAVPIFGIGYLLTVLKKFRKENLGHAVMGFSLMFVALGWLSEAVSLNAENMSFLGRVQDLGFWSFPIAVAIGIAVTALIHSSSAMTAIVITMAYNGLLTWEFSAALVIGSNIGSTVDSIMAAFGSKDNARRTALVHVIFNSVTAVLALVFLKQLTIIVDFITPGRAEVAITYHIAMLHTIFNVAGTLLFLPFTTQVARLTKKIIKDSPEDIPAVYTFPFPDLAAHESATIPLVSVRKEIQNMADNTVEMFTRIQNGLAGDPKEFVANHYDWLEKEEGYLDQMQEQLTSYLLKCQKLNLLEFQMNDINSMLSIVTELEALSDECLTVALFIKRVAEKNLSILPEDRERLFPYIGLVQQLLNLVHSHLGAMDGELSAEQFATARDLEERIDNERTALKKVARKRLEEGNNVKAELLYIDIVRKIEKMGDSCFTMARLMGERRA